MQYFVSLALQGDLVMRLCLGYQILQLVLGQKLYLDSIEQGLVAVLG